MEIKPFEIKDWQNGMAQSCHLGFEEIRGLDVFTVPGEMTVNYKLANTSISSSTPTAGIPATPLQIINGAKVGSGTLDFWLISLSGIWSGSSIKSGTFYHLCSYKKQLICSKSGYLSGYNGTTFYDDKIAIDGPDFMLSSLDDTLYISSGPISNNRINKVYEKAGQTFNINSSLTYTVELNVLVLPEDMNIVCMVDFGTYIAIACNSIYNYNKAYVYLWDGEATSASNRVVINGGNINAMIAKNNKLFCQVGNKGEWYISDGTSAEQFAKMPESFLTYSGAFNVYRNGLDFNEKGNIIFGIKQSTSGSNGLTPNGVFELNTENGKISFSNVATCGVGTSADPTSIDCLCFDVFRSYTVGWSYNNATFGIDDSSTLRITSYSAFVASPFYQLGSSISDKVAKIKGFEIHLTKNLPTGCGLKMYYRTTQGGTWVAWGLKMTTDKSIFWQTTGLDSIRNIQFKLEVTTPSGSNATPNILKIIIY